MKNHLKALKDLNGNFICPYCQSLWDDRRKLGGHISNCKNHPNKKIHDIGHIKARNNLVKKYISHEIIPSFLGKHHSNSSKEKISKSTSSRIINGNHQFARIKTKYFNVKTIDGNEYFVQGTWELNVANKLYELGIPWENKTRLEYQADILRHYRPDMTLKDRPNTYIEVKGYFSDQDKCKMKNVLLSNPKITIYFLHLDYYHRFINNEIALEDCQILTLDNISKIKSH